MTTRLVSLVAIAAAIAATAAFPAAASQTGAKPAMSVRMSASVPATPYASFLVGRYAMAMGDVNTASQALSIAANADPSDSDLHEKTFLINILNGDIDGAARLYPAGTDTASLSPTGQLMSGLVGAVTAAKAGKASVALTAIDGVTKSNSDERSAALLKPYIEAMAGKWDAAYDSSGDAALATNDRGALMVFLLKAERARLYEMQGKPADADALYKTLYQPGAASFVFGPDYAGFLERQGRKDEAKAVWQALIDASSDPLARDGVARLSSPTFTATPLPDLKGSMAQALLLSATLYSSDKDSEMALANLRLSLYLDPTSDRARLFLGQTEQDVKAPEVAEDEWSRVPVTSPYAGEAMLRRVWSLRGRDQNDAAIALVDAALQSRPDDLAFTVEKADILHDQGKDAEALKVLDGRISRKGEGDMTWQAYFIQAIAYDSVNDWPNAETAIKKAQKLNGQRPEILNFLGYGWIDRGLHVKEGMDLVRQAMNLSPHSGAIVDSLGWGYYKLGQYDQALSFVEQAVQMEPSDAEVNEHLGDVYKALGRDAEARYEWQRVLTLNATARETASVKAKLDTPATAGIAARAETTAFNDKAAKAGDVKAGDAKAKTAE